MNIDDAALKVDRIVVEQPEGVDIKTAVEAALRLRDEHPGLAIRLYAADKEFIDLNPHHTAEKVLRALGQHAAAALASPGNGASRGSAG